MAAPSFLQRHQQHPVPRGLHRGRRQQRERHTPVPSIRPGLSTHVTVSSAPRLAATSNNVARSGFFVEVVLTLHLQPELASPQKDHLGHPPRWLTLYGGYSDKLLAHSPRGTRQRPSLATLHQPTSSTGLPSFYTRLKEIF
jgi:hypothetical protein